MLLLKYLSTSICIPEGRGSNARVDEFNSFFRVCAVSSWKASSPDLRRQPVIDDDTE